MKHKEIIKELNENGYIVIKNAIDENDADELFDLTCKYFNTITNKKFNFDDKKTHQYLPFYNSDKGMYNYGFNAGFSEHCIKARMLTKHIFEELYKTNELVSSFDGFAFHMNETYKFTSINDFNENFLKNDWSHVDQTGDKNTVYQGSLSCTNQTEYDNTFLVWPKSHLIFEEYILPKCDDGGKKNFYKLKQEEKIEVMKKYKIFPKKIVMKKGDFVLWDSRTIHASAYTIRKAGNRIPRCQFFICMAKAEKFGNYDYIGELKKRQQAYYNKDSSTHQPLKCILFKKKYAIDTVDKYNIPNPISLKDLDDDIKLLHGLKLYKSQM